MNISFPPEDELFIKAKVEAGRYSNPAELILDAVRRLREHEDDRRTRLEAALELGEADIQAGRTIPYTPELLDQIEQEAIEHAAAGRRPNPDVCP